MSAAGWAIVTGASSGIGKALAFEFAKGGFNCASYRSKRNGSRGSCRRVFQKSFTSRTEVISADLSRFDSIDKLIAALASQTSKL